MSIRPLPAFLFAAAGGLLLAQLAAPPAPMVMTNSRSMAKPWMTCG